MSNTDKKLNELQEHLAKDLVELEENKDVSKEQLDKITDTYSKVYDIVTKLKTM
jgi:hypothetical protein